MVQPIVVRLETGAINAVGLSNPGWRGFLPELEEARRGGVPVIASLFGSAPAEFREMARGLDLFALWALWATASAMAARHERSPVAVAIPLVLLWLAAVAARAWMLG